nr:hypothetical protein [Tanacetum cinerariifolium]
MATTIDQQNSPFFRAFQVTADVPEIYMKEFWATAKLHHTSICFKIDTKNSILELEAFREMLHISPKIPSKSFAELPTEEEILEFLRYLGHSHEIRHLTDVNVNKLYQPWRSFASVINKCLTGKSSGVDSFRLSQAQILWGLITVETFTKVILDYFMTRKPSIPRRNRINCHYVRDDVLFSTIKVVSRHQTTQQYGAILSIKLTTDVIKNNKAYKEYYACATRQATPKPKASAKNKKGDSASSTTPPTPTPTTSVESAPRLSATTKDEGTGSRPGVPNVPSDDSEEELSWNSSDDEDVGGQDEGDKNDESDDGSDEGSNDDNDETVKAGSEKDKDDDDNEDDDNDEEEELVKNDDEDTETGKGDDEVSESEEEILEFLRHLRHSDEIRHLTDVNVEHKNQKRSNEMYYPRFMKVIIDYFMTRKPSIPRQNRINWHYVRDDVLFSTIKVAAPKPKSSARKKKGDSASFTTPPTLTLTTTVVAALRLSATAKDEGTSSRPGILDVPSDDSKEELSWNSSDDEDVDEQTKGREESEEDKTDESDDRSDDDNDDDNDETVKAGSERDEDDDDNDDEEELAKKDDEDTKFGKGGDEVSESEKESDKEEETRQEEEESFNPIPKTLEGSEDEGSNKEDQELRLSEKARIQEEEEADQLYRDININQGRGLQVTQNIKDSHVTLTPVHPDGLQESSSVLSFMTSMLNPISDVGVESIFTTASSPIVSLQTPTPIMTPSTIATITTSNDAPIPPTTIPIRILKNLLTFNLAFRFDERLRSLETTFFEYRQTNPFVDAVSAIPDIVHQYMTQQMTEA